MYKHYGEKHQSVDLVYVNTEELRRIFGKTPARVRVIIEEVP